MISRPSAVFKFLNANGVRRVMSPLHSPSSPIWSAAQMLYHKLSQISFHGIRKYHIKRVSQILYHKLRQISFHRQQKYHNKKYRKYFLTCYCKYHFAEYRTISIPSVSNINKKNYAKNNTQAINSWWPAAFLFPVNFCLRVLKNLHEKRSRKYFHQSWERQDCRI